MIRTQRGRETLSVSKEVYFKHHYLSNEVCRTNGMRVRDKGDMIMHPSGLESVPSATVQCFGVTQLLDMVVDKSELRVMGVASTIA